MPVPQYRWFAIAVAIAGVTAVEASGAFAADWPCFRGPNHDGTLNEKLVLIEGEPQLLWKAKVGKGNCTVSVADGRVFTAASGDTQTLLCLDARTGEKVWSASIPNGVAHSTPGVEQGKVFALMHQAKSPLAICLNAQDGTELWRAPLPASSGTLHYGPSGSPRVWEDLVFFNVGGGAAVRKGSGEIAWQHQGHTAYATPVVFQYRGMPAVAFFTGDGLIARDARSGGHLWSIPWKTSLHVSASDPLFFGERVLLCSAYGRGRSLYDLSGETPRVIWDNTTDGSGHSFLSGFATSGGVYFCTRDSLAKLDPDTGKTPWQLSPSGSFLLIGETLIRLTANGELSAGPFNSSAEFRPTLRAKVIDGTTYNTPAYSDGRLFVRNEGGDVACVRISR